MRICLILLKREMHATWMRMEWVGFVSPTLMIWSRLSLMERKLICTVKRPSSCLAGFITIMRFFLTVRITIMTAMSVGGHIIGQ